MVKLFLLQFEVKPYFDCTITPVNLNFLKKESYKKDTIDMQDLITTSRQ